MRAIDMNGDAIRAFQERLSRKARAVEAARLSFETRVRELVERNGRNGSKTGRADYSAWVGLDEIHRIRVALEEYDRVRALSADAFATPTPSAEGDDAE